MKDKLAELPISIQKDFNATLVLAYPLCILLSYKQYYPWYMEHYIQPWGIECSNHWTDIDMVDTLQNGYASGTFNRLLDVTPISYDMSRNISDIVSFLKEQIDNQRYVVLFIDDYYINGYRHFLHEHLIYGYNDSLKMFKSVNFKVSGTFSSVVLDYEMLENGFNNATDLYLERSDLLWLRSQAIVLFGRTSMEKVYPYSVSRIVRRLTDYASSRISSEEDYYLNFSNKSILNVVYGINVNNIVVKHLYNAMEYDTDADYNQIHLLYEQKKAINMRLQYLKSHLQENVVIEDEVMQYQQIEDAMNRIRMKLLKLRVKKTVNSEYKDSLSQIMHATQVMHAKEKEIMQDLLDKLISVESRRNDDYTNSSRYDDRLHA